MKQKYTFVAALLFVLMAASILLTNIYVWQTQSSQTNIEQFDMDDLEHTGQEFYILTSFYPMYIAAQNIVGDCDGVVLQNLSEPQTGCMHDYQLTTEDMRKLSYADAFVVNGGGIENFLSDVAKQYAQLAIINACEQIDLLEDNAHAWMSISNYMTQVRTIADALAALDTSHRAIYEKNAEEYLEKLEKLLLKQQEIVQQCEAQNIIIFHEAFDYIARDYGLTVSGSMDLDEERQVSAGETADILRQIREHGAKVILAEELYGRRMCETVQKETDVKVVYLDTCVRGDNDPDSYLKAMWENLLQMETVVTIHGSAN